MIDQQEARLNSLKNQQALLTGRLSHDRTSGEHSG